MSLRDLTEAQRQLLMQDCEQLFKQRQLGRRADNPLKWEDYKQGFSDGVFKTLKVLLPK